MPDCHFTTSIRSEAITPFRKQWLTHGTYHLYDALLNYPVHCSRDSQLTHSAVWFRYLHSPDRLGFVHPVPDLVPDTIPVLFDIIAKFFNCYLIHSSCPFVSRLFCMRCSCYLWTVSFPTALLVIIPH